MIGSMIVRGVERPVDCIVHTWLEHGMHFTCPTRRETRAVMNHWTAAENPPDVVYRNMRAHRNDAGQPEPLSVHFVVDAQGEAWQCADTEARCAHARKHGANHWSIGIEFVCRGTDLSKPTRGVYRDRQHDVIHGVLMPYDALTPVQIGTAIQLNAALCREYGLPMVVPEKDGDVYSTELPAAYIARFRGCMGHLQVERRKPDPGLGLLRALRDYGRTTMPPTRPRIA